MTSPVARIRVRNVLLKERYPSEGSVEAVMERVTEGS